MRRRSDAAGDRAAQPGGQRPRRHAGRRRAHGPCASSTRRARSAVPRRAGPVDRDLGAATPASACRPRSSSRVVRALLHHQGSRQGLGPRPLARSTASCASPAATSPSPASPATGTQLSIYLPPSAKPLTTPRVAPAKPGGRAQGYGDRAAGRGRCRGADAHDRDAERPRLPGHHRHRRRQRARDPPTATGRST